MALWDSIKKGAKKVSEGAVKISENMAREEEIKKKKTKILRRFTKRQLQNMAKNYGIKVKSADYDLFFDDKMPELTLDDYVRSIRSDLSYEEIFSYAKGKKINLADIVEEEKKKSLEKNVERTTFIEESSEEFYDEKIDAIIKSIKYNFEIDFPVNNEEDFEKHLYQYLKYHFKKPDWFIERQVRCGDSERIDILMSHQNTDFVMAMELKIGKDKSQLRSAWAQVYDYKEIYPNVLLIVLDVGKVNDGIYDNLKERLDREDIPLLILEGELKQKVSKNKRMKRKLIEELVK